MRLLAQSSWYILNRDILKKVGVDAAILLAALCDMFEFLLNKNLGVGIENSTWFYMTSLDIEEQTTLSYHKQKQALAILQDLGWVKVQRKGTPAKLYFTVVENKILNFLNTCSQNSLKQVSEDLQNTINNNKVTRTNKQEQSGQMELQMWPTFEDFWQVYDKKVDRIKAEKEWKKLIQKDREKAIRHAELYKKSTPDKKYRKSPDSYLRNKSYENEIIGKNGAGSTVFDRILAED